MLSKTKTIHGMGLHTSMILRIYLGDISANSATTHRLRICVVFFLRRIICTVLSLLACWSHEPIQRIVYCMSIPDYGRTLDKIIPACVTAGMAMQPPIAAVFVRSGFHCNVTLRFELTVIPFSKYLIVMYDQVTHAEIRPIQR
jgi:hypothetical protein